MFIHTKDLVGGKQGANVPRKRIRQGNGGQFLRALLCVCFTAALAGGGFLPPLHLGPGKTIIQMHYIQIYRTTS